VRRPFHGRNENRIGPKFHGFFDCELLPIPVIQYANDYSKGNPSIHDVNMVQFKTYGIPAVQAGTASSHGPLPIENGNRFIVTKAQCGHMLACSGAQLDR
jgi:hypothetical protein